jgi:4-amino-4-deoxy-L-arabinose transferase-like glycosyltransferase
MTRGPSPSRDAAPRAEPAWIRWGLPGAVALVALGVVLGAFNPAPHTGGDNAGYVALAYSLLTRHAYTEVFDPAALPHTKYPPVFPVLLAALVVLGARGWVALKSVAAAATVALTVLTHLWARRRLDAVPAAGVALAVALSSAVVYYSHWILSDPLFVALTVLSLWALEGADRQGAPPGWLALGIGGAGLAYFTRSAGLPLLVALAGWLALRRRWRGLVAAAVTLGAPALLWWLRGRSVAHAGYGSEFWLVDPYTPALGRVGIAGLAGRFGANLVAYVGSHVPGGIVGARGPAAATLGVALFALAVVGWVGALKARIGPTELFVPLYAGLILLWPVVWSGDRFALPLFPFLFGYAALALGMLGPRVGAGVGRIAGAAALLVVLLAGLKAWTGAVREASECGAVVRAEGPFACYGPGVVAFADAASWSKVNLPPGSAVLTRKPRLFYVLSGVPSRTFPFSDDPRALLGLADSLGARYVLLDRWDGLAARYVAGGVRRDPGAFCVIRGFGRDPGAGAELLGILPGPARGTPPAEGAVNIPTCPAAYVRGDGGAAYSPSSGAIPLLEDLDP